MDSTNCSSGWATDRIFQQSAPLCSTPMAAFWVSTMFLVLLRLHGSLTRYFQSKRRIRDIGYDRRRRNISLFRSFVSFSAVLLYFLLFLLTGIGIANFNNGVSFALVSIAFFPFFIDYSLSLIRLVRLGKKVTNLAIEVDERNILEKFEFFGIVLFSIQIASVAISSLVLIFLSTLYPEQELLSGKIGFAFK